jgi:hypothetical protein
MNASSRKIRLHVAILVLALAPACASLVNRISPQEVTDSAISETFVRIDLYLKKHGEPPANLAVLLTRDGYENRTTDAWGRKLQYTVGDEGIITLMSLGADGHPRRRWPKQGHCPPLPYPQRRWLHRTRVMRHVTTGCTGAGLACDFKTDGRSSRPRAPYRSVCGEIRPTAKRKAE